MDRLVWLHFGQMRAFTEDERFAPLRAWLRSDRAAASDEPLSAYLLKNGGSIYRLQKALKSLATEPYSPAS